MSSKGLWLLADRRLSFFDGRPPVDDAVKVFELGAVDGVALFGYAGLGLTGLGSEPSNWMLRVLRGLRVTVEQGVRLIGVALEERLAPHLLAMERAGGGREHLVLAIAIVDGKPCTYSWRAELQADGRVSVTGDYQKATTVDSPIWVFAGGTGRPYVDGDRIRRVIKAHDGGRLSAQGVAQYLASVNLRVHERCSETVGPRCIVVQKQNPPGGQCFYFTGEERDQSAPAIPAVVDGRDMQAFCNAVMDSWQESMAIAAKEAEALGLTPRQRLERFNGKAAFEEGIRAYDRTPKGPDSTLP